LAHVTVVGNWLGANILVAVNLAAERVVAWGGEVRVHRDVAEKARRRALLSPRVDGVVTSSESLISTNVGEHFCAAWNTASTIWPGNVHI